VALAKTLMIQGTASHVGKSVLTAALCRIFKNRGVRVAPFKAQNMSNNSFVTPDGFEIARAQAMQAEACGIEPHVWMSPVLLKPESDRRVQTVVMGRPWKKQLSLLEKNYRKTLEPIVLDALHQLRKNYDLVVIEGAGSPAEVNLQANDIVNMTIARAVKAPVILVGDIDAGGVFAQFVGTLELLPPADRKRVKAFLINKFRGDLGLLKPGLSWLEKKTSRRVLGVVPFLSDMDLAEEDSLSTQTAAVEGLRANRQLDQVSGLSRDRRHFTAGQTQLLIDVLWLPRLSNFTDFDLLAKQPGVRLRWMHEPDRHTVPDLIILPGTKSTMADLDFLRRSGLADYVLRSSRAGSWVLGICGGYQMLGEQILDREQVESSNKKGLGLGLLPAVTVFRRKKQTCRVQALHTQSGLTVHGYEIHMGETRLHGKTKAMFQITQRNGTHLQKTLEGASLKRGKSLILGTYLHGVLQNADFVHWFLDDLRGSRGLTPMTESGVRQELEIYDRLARKVQDSIDMDFLLRMADIVDKCPAHRERG